MRVSYYFLHTNKKKAIGEGEEGATKMEHIQVGKVLHMNTSVDRVSSYYSKIEYEQYKQTEKEKMPESRICNEFLKRKTNQFFPRRGEETYAREINTLPLCHNNTLR